MRLEEVLPALREGRAIRRGSCAPIVPPDDFALCAVEIMAEDWSVVEIQLSECPWCHDDFNLIKCEEDNGKFIRCTGCNVRGPLATATTWAIRKWNDRTYKNQEDDDETDEG
mgnify:CR=1 FL=1